MQMREHRKRKTCEELVQITYSGPNNKSTEFRTQADCLQNSHHFFIYTGSCYVGQAGFEADAAASASLPHGLQARALLTAEGFTK